MTFLVAVVTLHFAFVFVFLFARVRGESFVLRVLAVFSSLGYLSILFLYEYPALVLVQEEGSE